MATKESLFLDFIRSNPDTRGQLQKICQIVADSYLDVQIALVKNNWSVNELNQISNSIRGAQSDFKRAVFDILSGLGKKELDVGRLRDGVSLTRSDQDLATHLGDIKEICTYNLSKLRAAPTRSLTPPHRSASPSPPPSSYHRVRAVDRDRSVPSPILSNVANRGENSEALRGAQQKPNPERGLVFLTPTKARPRSPFKAKVSVQKDESLRKRSPDRARDRDRVRDCDRLSMPPYEKKTPATPTHPTMYDKEEVVRRSAKEIKVGSQEEGSTLEKKLQKDVDIGMVELDKPLQMENRKREVMRSLSPRNNAQTPPMTNRPVVKSDLSPKMGVSPTKTTLRAGQKMSMIVKSSPMRKRLFESHIFAGEWVKTIIISEKQRYYRSGRLLHKKSHKRYDHPSP